MSDSGASPDRALPRTLRLGDLVLAHVIVVVGANWTAVAAQLGIAGPLLWLLGVAAFHLPLGWVVSDLVARWPEEGGLYRWSRTAFGEGAAFLVGWNTWLFSTVFLSTLGIGAATAASYAWKGAAAAWLESPRWIVLASLLVVALLVALALSGLRVGRWVHDGGAVVLLGLLFALGAALARRLLLPGPLPIAWELPPLSLQTVSVFVKAVVYGLAGLECMAILAGEAQSPRVQMRRSILRAVPLVALFYVVGTAAVVVWVPRGEIDLVNPVAQVLTRASAGLPLLSAAGAVAIVVLFLRDFTQASLVLTANSRLPMVAGWDGLLPGGFGRLDRRGVPRASVLVAGAVTLTSALFGAAGAARQEAFQILLATAGVFFGSTYAVLFAIPLCGRIEGSRPGAGLRLAAASGLLLTVAFLVLSVLPFGEVPRPLAFGMRVAALALLGEAAGVLLLWRLRARQTPRPVAAAATPPSPLLEGD